jgi:hypothetical protein
LFPKVVKVGNEGVGLCVAWGGNIVDLYTKE